MTNFPDYIQIPYSKHDLGGASLLLWLNLNQQDGLKKVLAFC